MGSLQGSGLAGASKELCLSLGTGELQQVVLLGLFHAPLHLSLWQEMGYNGAQCTGETVRGLEPNSGPLIGK